MAIFFPQFFPKDKKLGQNPKILPQILVPLAGLEPARSLLRGILSFLLNCVVWKIGVKTRARKRRNEFYCAKSFGLLSILVS